VPTGEGDSYKFPELIPHIFPKGRAIKKPGEISMLK